MESKGILIVLSGPSGAGKGTICKALLKLNDTVQYSVSATTRNPRHGEEHGIHYFFHSTEDFKCMIEKDEFLEWAQVYNNYYGTPKTNVEKIINEGKDCILEIDIQGAMQIKKKMADAVFVFIVPPSLEELTNRILKRGTEGDEQIKTRMSCVKKELSFVSQYDYVIVNDDVEIAANKMAAIIKAEKCRVTRNLDFLDELDQTNI